MFNAWIFSIKFLVWVRKLETKGLRIDGAERITEKLTERNRRCQERTRGSFRKGTRIIRRRDNSFETGKHDLEQQNWRTWSAFIRKCFILFYFLSREFQKTCLIVCLAKQTIARKQGNMLAWSGKQVCWEFRCKFYY